MIDFNKIFGRFGMLFIGAIAGILTFMLYSGWIIPNMLASQIAGVAAATACVYFYMKKRNGLFVAGFAFAIILSFMML